MTTQPRFLQVEKAMSKLKFEPTLICPKCSDSGDGAESDDWFTKFVLGREGSVMCADCCHVVGVWFPEAVVVGRFLCGEVEDGELTDFDVDFAPSIGDNLRPGDEVSQRHPGAELKLVAAVPPQGGVA
ncbi:MAG: hypothetical protein COX57_08090 [Alphaproteobacteria bacterium CG_4_10_14_0_2_um_filter_63_37]|nr:MAG: hypothetical protein AUJ55_00035 [Proteobacteria bacterium CG1_02_64_396]PJA24509.1 MAG: hypothetical protein COX57_08090 [Alphaproteobacteria bacterium CG_4_10_14_0_2_um_filter_63_37]